MTDIALACIHCGCTISDDPWPIHVDGSQARLHSCGRESGLKYGYEAHAALPCVYPCLGATQPDPRLS